MIKAVIYDLDDLMVNSEKVHDEAFEEILTRHGKSMKDIPDELSRKFVGMRIVDITKILLAELKLELDIDEFLADRNAIFLELAQKKIELMPGLINSVELLHKNGLKLAIASSGKKEYIQTIVEKFKLGKYFDKIISGDDVKLGKPNPEPYIVTCNRLGLLHKECLVLEDATNGIISAKSAGCYCIAVKNPYTPTQDLSRADTIIDDLNHLDIEMIKDFG